MGDQLTIAKELLARLVAFDTTSHKSNLGLISFVEGYLEGFGIDCHRVPTADGLKSSLFAGTCRATFSGSKSSSERKLRSTFSLPASAASACPGIPTWCR